MNNTEIARWAHEINRAVQGLTGESVNPPWEDCSRELKDSTITGVNKAKAGLTSQQLHEAWVEYKIAEGWVYGPVKDFELKTHPCLVPYSDLPPEQRLKDSLFRVVVEYLKD